MKSYLKTYFYSEHEYEFINANLRESLNHVDSMILCEYDIHHTGLKREMIFDINRIDEDLRHKLEYYPCEVHGKETVEAYDDEATIHRINEPVMRSYFTKLKDFDKNDIIYSVDADEIIYERTYQKMNELVSERGKVRLLLHQFFYKKNYLWKNKVFASPGAFLYGATSPKYMNNWRDDGMEPTFMCGAHFSWCMDVPTMIKKLHVYSHPRYRNCADEKLLTDAIENKTYPFDPSVKFEIEELDWDDMRIPDSMRP